jgi:hypothetical protein
MKRTRVKPYLPYPVSGRWCRADGHGPYLGLVAKAVTSCAERNKLARLRAELKRVEQEGDGLRTLGPAFVPHAK